MEYILISAAAAIQKRELANITLEWLIKKAKDAGADFNEEQLQKQLKQSQKTLHNSLTSNTWLAGVWPRGVPAEASANTNSPFGYLHSSVVNEAEDFNNEGGGGKRIQWLKKGEKVSVKINSGNLWDTTGIVLEAGAEYQLAAHGIWTDRTRELGPEGESRHGLLWYLPGKWLRFPSAKWFELVGLISAPRRLHSKSESIWRALSYLIIQDPLEFRKGQFRIGKGVPLPSIKETGILSCYANDHWWFFRNNEGSIDLEITRLT